jgi:hypothetical protein
MSKSNVSISMNHAQAVDLLEFFGGYSDRVVMVQQKQNSAGVSFVTPPPKNLRHTEDPQLLVTLAGATAFLSNFPRNPGDARHLLQADEHGDITTVSRESNPDGAEEGFLTARESTQALKAKTIDDANTALAVAYTRQERLSACETLIAAAQAEAQRLRAAIAKAASDQP